MRTTLWPMVAITFFTSLGNAQDDAVPAATGYAAQGNVEMNKAQNEAELQRAVQASRQQKALKEAMAVYAQKPSAITTAEQFLAVNRPPTPPPSEDDAGMSPVKTSIYVPEFQTTENRVNSSAPTAAPAPVPATPAASEDLPEGKRGFFSFLRSKTNRSVDSVEGSPNRSSYPPPAPAPPAPAPPVADYITPGDPVDGAIVAPGSGITVSTDGEVPATDPHEAITAATVSSGSSSGNSGFFSRLFGKGKKAGSSAALDPL